MAPHSSTLAWKILWTEEPGGLQSMGSLRVGHDWVTSLSFFIFMHWRGKWQHTPVFLPGESQGARWAAVYGVTQSWTQLKWFSSSRTEEFILTAKVSLNDWSKKLRQVNLNQRMLYENEIISSYLTLNANYAKNALKYFLITKSAQHLASLLKITHLFFLRQLLWNNNKPLLNNSFLKNLL